MIDPESQGFTVFRHQLSFDLPREAREEFKRDFPGFKVYDATRSVVDLVSRRESGIVIVESGLHTRVPLRDIVKVIMNEAESDTRNMSQDFRPGYLRYHKRGERGDAIALELLDPEHILEQERYDFLEPFRKLTGRSVRPREYVPHFNLGMRSVDVRSGQVTAEKALEFFKPFIPRKVVLERVRSNPEPSGLTLDENRFA